MTQIAQGAHAYIFPEPGQVYRVQADDVATVQIIYGAPSALITLTAQSQTFGPYDSPAKLKVSANTAACEYTLIRAHYAELTQQQLDSGAVGVLASDNAGGAIEPDGDVPSLGGTESSVTVVNDLTTGGTTAALSAEMGKTLQTSKLGANADAIADVLEASATGAPADLARIQYAVSGDLLPYHGDGSDLAAALLVSAHGVSIRSAVTVSATITIPAGKAVEIYAGVTYTKSGGGTDAFVFGGVGAAVVGAGTISGGRYAVNTGGQSVGTIGSDSRQSMLRIRGTVLHGIWVDGFGHLVAYCDVDAGQSGIAMSGASNCVVHDNYTNACTNFGIWLATACHDNHIYKNWCDESGLELVGVTYDCHDNHIYENKARSTGDNGISVTGYRNTVENNECTGCKNHGIGIYGERNTVVGNYGKNNGHESLDDGGQYAGITCTPAFGGLARKNVIVGNHFDDDQARPTQYCVVKIGTDAYVAWASGQVVANSNLYRKNGTAIYRATGPGTTGATAPTHTSGDASDGGVTWRWVCDTVSSLARSYPAWAAGVVITDENRYQHNGRIVYRSAATGGTTGASAPVHTSGSASDGGVTWVVYEESPNNLDAYDNTIVGNGGSGNSVSDPVLDLTTNRNLYFSVGRIQIPAPGRNQSADYIVGTGTPEGVVVAKPGSLYSRQDVSVQGIALWSKQTGVSNTGWLRVALQDGGTTAQRPVMSGYGTGARGYSYFDTTLGKPIWWSSSAWVDATGATV